MASNPYTRTTMEGHTVAGNAFYATIKLSVTASQTSYYSLSIPAGVQDVCVFMSREMVTSSNGAWLVSHYPDAVVSTTGTPFPVFNANPQSAKQTQLQISPVTVSVAGQPVDEVYLPASGRRIGGNFPQGSIRVQSEGSLVVGAKSITAAGSADLYITYTWIQVPNIQDL